MKTAGILALTVATVFAQGSYNDIYGYRNAMKGSGNTVIGSNIVAAGNGNRITGNMHGWVGNGLQMFGVNAQPEFVRGEKANFASLSNYQGNLPPGASNADVFREAASSMRNWAPPGQQPTLSNYQATAANNWDWSAY